MRQRIETALESLEEVVRPFAEGVQDTHQDFPGLSALLGLRTEADLAGDDQGTQLAFGAVVVSGDSWMLGPVVESSCFLAEYVLDFLNANSSSVKKPKSTGAFII